MSEQPIDVHVLLVALRRYRPLIIALTLIGCAAGVVLSLLLPAPFTSTSLVLMRAPSGSQGSAAAIDITTQAQIAISQPVLDQALATAGADLTVRELQDAVSVSTPTDSLLEFEVRSRTAADAESLATSVADAYAAYVALSTDPLSEEGLAQLREQVAGLEDRLKQVQDELETTRARLASEPADSAQSTRDAQLVALLVGQEADLAVQLSEVQKTLSLGAQVPADSGGLAATVIQSGTTPTHPSAIGHAVLWAAACGLVGAAMGALVALVRTRRDPRVRSTRDLSRALGAPVLAGIVGRPRRRAEDWPELLRTYEPPALDAWVVRLLLREILGAEGGVRGTVEGKRGRPQPRRATVVVLSFTGDSAGLALGPQLAAIAASLGVRTALVAAGSDEFVDGLAAGLALARRSPDLRENLALPRSLQDSKDHELAFVVAAVDPAQPRLQDLPPADEHLLCIGAGRATAEELAMVALAADAAGRQIDGAVVCDPKSWDTPPSSTVGLPPVTSARPAPVAPLAHAASSGAKRPSQRQRSRR